MVYDNPGVRGDDIGAPDSEQDPALGEQALKAGSSSTHPSAQPCPLPRPAAAVLAVAPACSALAMTTYFSFRV